MGAEKKLIREEQKLESVKKQTRDLTHQAVERVSRQSKDLEQVVEIAEPYLTLNDCDRIIDSMKASNAAIMRSFGRVWRLRDKMHRLMESIEEGRKELFPKD